MSQCIDSSKSKEHDEYNENLLVKGHQDGSVSTTFQFKTLWSKDHRRSHWNKHYDLFPFAIGSLLIQHEVQELHFSLTNGHWRHRRWGLPVRNTSPGGELWLWLSPFHSQPSSAWKEISNKLSAQFCASMNFNDNPVTVNPALSFRPEGLVDSSLLKNRSVFYASLASESACTENLTPWKKLLPTFGKSGLASILSTTHLFDSNYISLALDVKPVCYDEKCSNIHTELTLSLTVVFNPTSKTGKQNWSLYRLFGSTLQRITPLASSTIIYVDITSNNSASPFELTPSPDSIVDEKNKKLAVYDLKKHLVDVSGQNSSSIDATQGKPFNLAAKYSKNHLYGNELPPYITITRSVTGYGQHSGGILTKITNRHTSATRVIYMDVIPWYVRIYTHTLSIRTASDVNGNEYTLTGENFDDVHVPGRTMTIQPDSFIYTPSKDRISPHHLELLFTLPPNSVTTITMDFERAFLKWTEFPPDPNHGLYVGSAILTFRSTDLLDLTLIPNSTAAATTTSANLIPGGNLIRLYTECLIISLPTPDFSMPYNVICLVSTVISLAFGPIHSLTTQKFKPPHPKK